MYDTFQVTHEGATEVKRANMNTLTHEYELFRMKLREIIQDMEKCFIHFVNHMRTLGKTFLNEYLINKACRCLNCSWQLKVIVIYESKNLSYMDFATLL